MASTQQQQESQRSTFGWGSSPLSRTLHLRSPFGARAPVASPQGSGSTTTAPAAGLVPGGVPAATTVSSDGKRQTLFGPHIGGDGDEDEDDDVRAFAPRQAGGTAQPETVSVETVKAWIDKSKAADASTPHATTTLQSLVNLKRPSLSFLPLEAQPDLHTVKFTYDSAAPTVLITLSLHLPSPTPTDPHLHTSEIVWSGSLPGGFAKSFQLPQESAIDLAQATALLDRLAKNRDIDLKRKETAAAASSGPDVSLDAQNAASQANGGRRGLFGLGRARASDLEAQNQSVQMTAVSPAAGPSPDIKEAKLAVRIIVRLEGRGEKGEALASLNAQQTHIEIAPVAATAPASGATGQDGEAPSTDAVPSSPSEGAIDVAGGSKNPWTAKVVRREALIGSHTFHLREIFGLTSSTTNAAPPPSTAAAYPPQPDDDPYASTPNECIICLVSPRDVVLLPCRHLVVCKDCAIGMVEFGAGGKVLRRDGEGEISAGGDAAAAGGGETSAEGAAAATGAAPATPAPSRRKKKAKGWSCPICRQPYTSMLRIALPSIKAGLQTSVEAEDVGRPSSIQKLPHSHDEEKADAVSVRSGRSRTGHATTARSPSPTPTLPGRAASILYPNGVPSDDEEDDVAEPFTRPQFVLGAAETGQEATEEERRKRIEKDA